MCYNLSVITMVVIAPALMMFLTSSIIVIPMIRVRRTTVLTVRIAIHWNIVTIDIWRPASFPLFLLSNLLGATNFLSISSQRVTSAATSDVPIITVSYRYT